MSAGIDKTVPLKDVGASIVSDWLAATSFVSTIFSKSVLFKIFSGKKDPTAVIEALIFFKLVI